MRCTSIYGRLASFGFVHLEISQISAFPASVSSVASSQIRVSTSPFGTSFQTHLRHRGSPQSAFILVLILHGRCGSGAVSRSFLHLVHGPVPATIPTSMLVGASCLPRFSSSRLRYPS